MLSPSRKILSEKVTFISRTGAKLVGYYDHSVNADSLPFVLLLPGYAETKRDYISFSYYLVSNGLRVLRYDHSYHLGESDGDISETDPSKLEADLVAALDYIERTFGQGRPAVIASSLLARIAMRLARSDSRIGMLVSLVGVVDFRKSLCSVYREDLIGQYKSGHRWGRIDILGHRVSDSLLGQVINRGLDTLQGTKLDVVNLHIPILFIAAERDVWVDIQDVREVYNCSSTPGSELYLVSGALHQIEENPRLAQRVICKAVSACVEHLIGLKIAASAINKPNLHEIVSQNKVELEVARQLAPISKQSERAFWGSYLSSYSTAYRSADFRDLLGRVAEYIGQVKEGDRILDAGCGNGLFGIWLLDKASQKTFSGFPRFTYVGLDFSLQGLTDAVRNHGGLQRRLAEKGKSRIIQFQYVLADLDSEVPFLPDSFDKITCNLVISYLFDYKSSIKRLMRILRGGGRIVVSSLKPRCDLSLVYHRYVTETIDEDERDDAKNLLSNTGQIRKKEREGHYRFFTGKELRNLLQQAGARNVRIAQSLGEQANIAVGEKK